ncbi:MAG: PepSY domain-containing protein [Rubripirellula sp.]
MTETDPAPEPNATKSRRPRKLSSRVTMLLRRIHLYVGLFLLPWVFLYGITGAMFNHSGLFPESSIAEVSSDALAETTLADFPTAKGLAEQVLDAIRAKKPAAQIELNTGHAPEFANDVMMQISDAGIKHAVHVDPIEKSAWVATFPKDEESIEPLLSDVRNVKLSPDPYEAVQKSVPKILQEAGVETKKPPKPMGWSKLNFLATIDGEPARVTYVLRDGHVDISKHKNQDGMTPRHFFLRLHTSHGQPPHWNGRMFWSLFVDVMACAMVTWGLTGLVMWWQIKRTRMIGGVVIAISVATAGWMYLNMLQFYATTKL